MDTKKKIEIVLTQSLIKDDLELKDKNIIIIDVLRSSTTMAVALTNGAKEIVPADNVTTAAKIARGTGKSLLCGEREGKIVEGFDSPSQPSWSIRYRIWPEPGSPGFAEMLRKRVR